MRQLLIFPMALCVFYMFGFAVYMFLSRARSVRRGEISLEYFKVYDGERPSGRAELLGQHYENQFEVPILFLITCVLFISLNRANFFTVACAWIFVISRGAHAWIHLGQNKVRSRAAAFAIGWLTLLVLWLQLLVFNLT